MSPRNAILRESLAQSRIVVFDSQDDMLDFAEAYAPEHLIVSLRDPWPAARRITTAGSGSVVLTVLKWIGIVLGALIVILFVLRAYFMARRRRRAKQRRRAQRRRMN